MRILRKFGVILLLAVSSLTPAMACMLPDTQMTAQERACCRMMHNQCEQMGMSAAHGCCQKMPQSIYAVPATKADPLQFVAIPVSNLTAFELLNASSALANWGELPDDSPPQSPPSTISILRI